MPLFWGAILSVLGKLAAGAKAAAAAGAKVAATAAKSTATAAVEAGPAIAKGASELGGKVGGLTESVATAPLDTAQATATATPKPAPAPTVAPQPTAAPQPASGTTPVQTPNPPAVEALLKPDAVMQNIKDLKTSAPVSTQPAPASFNTPAPNMSTPTGPAVGTGPTPVLGGRLSSEFGVTGGRIGPQEGGLVSRIRSSVMDFMDDFDRAGNPDRKQTARSKKLKPVAETLDTIQKAKRVKDQFEALGGQRDEGVPPLPSIPGEQAQAPTPPLNLPQIDRVATQDLRLARGPVKEGERPLTSGEIQGLRRTGIDELIAELRTNRRLFG